MSRSWLVRSHFGSQVYIDILPCIYDLFQYACNVQIL